MVLVAAISSPAAKSKLSVDSAICALSMSRPSLRGTACSATRELNSSNLTSISVICLTSILHSPVESCHHVELLRKRTKDSGSP